MLMTWRAQGEYVAVSRLETIYQANSKAIHQIYIYGNSLRSHLLAVVVPVGARPHTRVRIPFSDKPDKWVSHNTGQLWTCAPPARRGAVCLDCASCSCSIRDFPRCFMFHAHWLTEDSIVCPMQSAGRGWTRPS